MKTTVSEQENITICAVDGEVDMYHSPTLLSVCRQLANRDTSGLILNLNDTTYIDSSGIGVLMQIMTYARENKKRFALCHAGGMVIKLLQLSGMSRLFPLEPDLEKALLKLKDKT